MASEGRTDQEEPEFSMNWPWLNIWLMDLREKAQMAEVVKAVADVLIVA